MISDDDQLLLQFEQGTLPKDQWTHTAHVRVAYSYVQRYGTAHAMERMRSGIRALNSVHGTKDTPTSGYHETITQAWIRVLGALWDGCEERDSASRNLFQKHPELAQSNLLSRYYSRELLMSSVARVQFVAPDRAPLP
jgi:hypothetical protein